MYDIIIIGCGPAGMSAAVYGARANKNVLILECESIGGQMASAPRIDNYPGYTSIMGNELADKMYESVEKLGIDIEIEKALEVSVKDDIITVKTDVKEYQTRSLIIATGSKYKTLGIPSEEKFIGNGISFCVQCDGSFYKGKTVAVIGGANSALGNALLLSDICKKVYLIHHSKEFKAEAMLQDKVLKKDNIEVIFESEIIEYLGDIDLTGVKLKTPEGEVVKEVDGVFLSIGTIPEGKFVKNILNVDDTGYIISNDCTTNIPGIFVAGDCRTKKTRQITVATGDGTNAALLAIDYLNSKF